MIYEIRTYGVQTGSLAEVDPAIAQLIQHEQAHQFAKLIMIASRSSSRTAARTDAVGRVGLAVVSREARFGPLR